MTNEEKYKLLLFQTVRNEVFTGYAQVLELEKAKAMANQVAIVTISKFPEIVDFDKLKPDYETALAAVKKEYIKEGKVFLELPELKIKPDLKIVGGGNKGGLK